MKTLGLLLIALFISSANYTQDSIMSILNETFPAYELNSDLAFIKNKAVYKRYNYNGLLYAGKEQFYKLYDSIETVINSHAKMSRMDFYFLTAPLIQLLQDDVSIYSLVGKYAFDPRREKYLPFAEKSVITMSVTAFNDTVYITDDSSSIYKSRLISINDVPADKIVSEICKYTSFSKYAYYNKHKYASLNLYYNSVILYTLFGFHDEVKIKYSPYGADEVLTRNMQLLPIGDTTFYKQTKQNTESLPWYSIHFENDIAILRVTAMPRGELNLQAIDDIFKKIHANKSSSLIIDISDCSWSYDNFWIVILNYLYEGELSLYEHQKKQLDLSKFSKKRINNSSFILGKYSDINKDHQFKGKVYLITGSSTTSSAVRFADILQYNNISTKIFGKETLTKTTQYDFYNSHYLPVTGLSLGLSMTLYYALDKNTNIHGLIPDIEVGPKNGEEFLNNLNNKLVIDRVINLIESENTTHEDTSR